MPYDVAPDIVSLDYLKRHSHVLFGAAGTITHNVGLFHWNLAALYKMAADAVSDHVSLVVGTKVKYTMQENSLQFHARVARRQPHECLTFVLQRVPAVS